jgi:nitrogen fixation protein FixH
VRTFERIRNRGTGHGARAPASGALTGRTVLWSLLGFFGVVIGANAAMTAFAIRTMPGLEVESPYLAGLKYNAEIAAARAQAARGWQIGSHVERDAEGRAVVTVEARDRDGAALTGLAMTVRLARPTDKRADHVVALTERSSGGYRGEAIEVVAGVWDVEIEAGRGDERMFRSKNRVTLN